MKTKHRTLEIVLADENAQVEVHLLYGVLEETDIITRSVRIKNTVPDRLRSKRQRQPVWILYRESLMSCGFMESMPGAQSGAHPRGTWNDCVWQPQGNIQPSV